MSKLSSKSTWGWPGWITGQHQLLWPADLQAFDVQKDTVLLLKGINDIYFEPESQKRDITFNGTFLASDIFVAPLPK